MDIHKLHAPHSWGEFLREIGVIICGVLIALGLEQGVQWVHDRHVADETRAAIRAEIEENLTNVRLVVAAEPCTERRLVEISDLLDRWARTGTFTTPRHVGQTPALSTSFIRYDAALSAGRLALLSSEEQFRIGTIYSDLRDLDAIVAQDSTIWPRLRSLQAGANVLNAGDQTDVRAALQNARQSLYARKFATGPLLEAAGRFGYPPSVRRLRETIASETRFRQWQPSICEPIDRPQTQVDRDLGLVLPTPD